MQIDFKFDIIDLVRLIPDSQNCRIHSKENLEYIKSSLKEFGFQKPIVVNEKYEIACGNGTYLAAKELGINKIPVAISSLPLEKLKAFAIADNQIPLSSTWDLSKLSDQLQSLAVWNPDRDWASLGFNENELKLMLSFDEDFKAEVKEEDFKQPAVKSQDGVNADSAEKVKYKPLKINDDQRITINRAIDKVRQMEGDKSIPEGQALELICSEFLS